jgi:hypothetical protein
MYKKNGTSFLMVCSTTIFLAFNKGMQAKNGLTFCFANTDAFPKKKKKIKSK